MIVATLCYIKRDGKTLMIHRNKKPNDIHEGKWNGLGGKIEAGESPEMCIKREIHEEAGLVIESPHLHGLLMFANFKGNDWYVFVYTVTEFAGKLIDSPEGTLEWIEDANLLDLPLWPSDQIFFPWLQRKNFFSARFQYDGERMLEYEVTFH
jgi:8-oxo-dGTP diphosphatase